MFSKLPYSCILWACLSMTLIAAENNDVATEHALALKLNHSGQYREAIPHLEKSLKATQDIELFYELGVAYLETGETAKAVQGLEIYSQVKPDNAKAQFALGRALTKLGFTQRAEAAFKKASELDPTLSSEAKSQLAQLQAPAAKSMKLESETKFWQVLASLFVGYNSNVIGVPEGRPIPSDIFHEDAPFINSSIDGQYRWMLNNGDQVSAGYNFCSIFYPDLAAADSLDHEWRGRYDHTFNREWSTSFTLSDGFSQIANKDFCNRVTLTPAAVYQLTEQSIVALSYSATISDYFRPVPIAVQDRDSHSHMFSADTFFTVPTTDLHVNLGVFGGMEDAEGSDFDSSSYGFVVGAGHPLIWDFDVNASYSLRFDDYDHLNSVAGPNGFAFNRSDSIDVLSIRLTRPINNWLTGIAQYSYNNMGSNIPTFSYRQDVFSFGVNAKF